MNGEPPPPPASPADPADSKPAGWVPLPSGRLVRPTYWPAGLGLGITFIFWGVVTSWVVLVAGLGLCAACLAGWIKELCHE